MRVIVVPPPDDYEQPVYAEGRYGVYYAGVRTIVLPEDWLDRDGVVHHEAAHDFFKEHMASIITDGADRETAAVNEGIAQAVEQEVGGANVPDPRLPRFHASLTVHGTHAAGRHIVKALEDYATNTSRDAALKVFLDAIREFEDRDANGRADISEFVRAAVNVPRQSG